MHVSRDNTARQFHVLNNPTPVRAAAPSLSRRASGIGLLGAVAVSLALWVAIIALGAIVMSALSH